MVRQEAAGIAEAFRNRYGRDPAGVTFAPGRVNVIGEHTDYNEGFVLPAAVNLGTYVAFAPRETGEVRLYSETSGEEAVFGLDETAKQGLPFWALYAWGTGMSLLESGASPRAFDGFVSSTVPVGGGLSSSASLEVALALAYLGREADGPDRLELVHVCRRAENDFVGVNCGVMDQFASVFGAESKALLIDCRSLEYREVPFPEGAVLVVADTGVRHALGETGYHNRQEECRAAAGVLVDAEEDVRSLRDATSGMLAKHAALLGEVLLRRARHVVTENARVIKAAEAMAAGDVDRLGRLMAQSHRSLRDDFEVSCSELDVMVEEAEGIDGHFGTRMTGGGFGGCTVSLVEKDKAPTFAEVLCRRYGEKTGRDCGAHIVRPGNGAGFVA